MLRTVTRALGVAALFTLIAGGSIAGASTKFASAETIQFPAGDLEVTFEEGSQKRFASVDYQLTATAVSLSCDTVTGRCVSAQAFPTDTVAGLVPDENGRVSGRLTLAAGSGGGTVCECTLHMDYSDVTLTNLTSGHVYRLDPISGDSP